jgi:GDPmannose 4,6-dehydratase
VLGTQNLLEALRTTGQGARLFHASSSECFGDLDGIAAREDTRFQPRSPYGVAKACAHSLVATYREAYGLFAANGILFNHESPLRPSRFVTRKVTRAASRIAGGRDERLALARIDVVRDWGWAPEYVEAMWRMLQQPAAEDFVLATGQSRPLSDFVAAAFAACGLDWRDHVDIRPAQARPSDPQWSGADPSRAAEKLGWKARTLMPEVARLMAEQEYATDETEECAGAQ